MALINCPQCGKQISDKAQTCIYCGFDLSGLHDEVKHTCPECGFELEEGATVCPNCGCPIEDTDSSIPEEPKPQQVEVTGIRNGRKILIAIIAVVIVAGIAVLAGTQIKKQNDAKLSEEYKNNLTVISFLMLDGAADTESAGNLVKSVWSNCINEKKDTSTDNYTRDEHGNFYSDFNTALTNLYSDADFRDDISAIESNQNEVKNMMKDMKNPPDEWTEAYEVLNDYYDSYVSFTNMVLNPSGSLMTYSSNFNDADSEVLNSYQKLSLYLE